LPDFTPIDHKDQFANRRQVSQQFTHERHVKALILNPIILYPATVSFDPTVSFGLIGRFAGDGWQLTASGLHDSPRYRSQCVQIASKITFWFGRKQLFHCHSDGTIYPTIVYKSTPVLPWREIT
jgi:hypothetical protein